MLYLEIRNSDSLLARLLPPLQEETFTAPIRRLTEMSIEKAALSVLNHIKAIRRMYGTPNVTNEIRWIWVLSETLNYAADYYPNATLHLVEELFSIDKKEMQKHDRMAERLLQEEEFPDPELSDEEIEDMEYREALDKVDRCSCGAYYMKKDQTLGIRADCCCGA